MKRLLVVGSGSGGTLTANLLARSLKSKIHRGEASVNLVGDNPYHIFQPGYLDVAFKGGETIRTEISRKWTPHGLEGLLARTGLELERWFVDPREWFGLSLSRRARPRDTQK